MSRPRVDRRPGPALVLGAGLLLSGCGSAEPPPPPPLDPATIVVQPTIAMTMQGIDDLLDQLKRARASGWSGETVPAPDVVGKRIADVLGAMGQLDSVQSEGDEFAALLEATIERARGMAMAGAAPEARGAAYDDLVASCKECHDTFQ